MIFPGYETNTDVTCLQMIAKKEVIAKNRGAGGACNPCTHPINLPPHHIALGTWYHAIASTYLLY